jgi:mycothiol synthase
MDVTITSIAIEDQPAHDAYTAVWNTIVPREPVTAAEVVENRVRRRDDHRFLARADWQIAGIGMSFPSDLAGRTFVRVGVLEGFRRQGIGTQLLGHAVEVAQLHGSELVSSAVEEGDQAGEAFAAAFGFVERLREVEVIRHLAGDEPEPEPVGFEIVPVSSRPGLVEGAYALARVALPEMPLPVPYEAPPFEQWADEDAIGPRVIAGGTLVAVEDGRVVGFAGLLARGADPHLAEHGLTAVVPDRRARGIATALKRAQIAWAARNGYRRLITWTQDRNAPMQRVNAKLGYEPQPAWIRVEAPLATLEAVLRR